MTTYNDIKRVTWRRNEAAAAMDECELAEAHRDEEGSYSTYEAIVNIIEKNRDNLRDMGWCVRRY